MLAVIADYLPLLVIRWTYPFAGLGPLSAQKGGES